MAQCRSCGIEINSKQLCCPNCGIKYPLLDKEDLGYFREFKQKIKPYFVVAVIILILVSVFFLVKIPVTETISYMVKEFKPSFKTQDLDTECEEKRFQYSLNYFDFEYYKSTLRLVCNIENKEDKFGIFDYELTAMDQLTLEELSTKDQVFLEPYENKTVEAYFYDVYSIARLKYECKVIPPIKQTCVTDKEQVIEFKETETEKTKDKTVTKSPAELILEKI